MDRAPNIPLIVIQSAPYQGSLARAALDLALSFAAFAQQPQLLFCGSGVLCLKKDQRPEAVGRKSLRKVVDSFPLYDLDTVFVESRSLDMLGVSATDLPGFSVVCSDKEVRLLIQGASHVINL